jgi:hypothetical protein
MIANRKFTLMTALAIAGGAVACLSPATASANLLANPGFENGTGGGSLSGWFGFGNQFPEGTNTGVPTHSGDGVAKMFGTFSGGFGVSGLFQEFPAAPGQQFEMDVFTRQVTGDSLVGTGNWAVQKIAFFNAANTEIGAGESTIMSASFPLDTWVDNAPVLATAPAGTAKVQAFLLFLQPNNQGGAALFDDASFLLVPEPASLGVLGTAAAVLAGGRRRRPC